METRAFASFYQFSKVAQPEYFKDLLIEQCEIAGIMGTIILSSEGVNGSIVGSDTAISSLLEFLVKNLQFSDLLINRSKTKAKPFDRLVVRIKDEIVTSGLKHKPLSSDYVEPEEPIPSLSRRTS